MKKKSLILIILLGLSFSLSANTFLPEDVPSPLQPWINWVLYNTQDCPQALKKVCQWPSRLTLTANNTQAEFHQEWQIYNAAWITLPGNPKHWPQQVQINDKIALVADRKGVPSIFAPKGSVVITGHFFWQQIPEFLKIPINTGMVALTINDKPVTIPQLDKQGRLWLRQQGNTSEQLAEENRLDIRIFRHISDDIPLQVITRIELDVSGHHREVVLGPIMLDKQIAMSLNSRLPARLETDGRLRLQVRPGSWTLFLHARQIGATNQLKAVGQKEIWVFEAHNDLRLVEIHQATTIDPQQTSLPAEWRKFPAYQMQAGDIFKLVEKRRGDPIPAPDRLTLKRNFWLDFDGKGYSIQDHITGTMTRGWRLEMAESAVLGRVAVNGQNQFITRMEDDGIEVRHGQINIVADSRLEEAVTQLPAVGWRHDFQNVSATLHLPPGWRLLNATGADDIPDTWLKQWTLLDLFIVLIMAAAVSKLWHWRWGALTLLTLVVIYHELHAPHWVWLNIIISLALLRVLPTLGWFSRFVRGYRNISLLALILIALPFMMQQIRQSIYPQLEKPWATLEKQTYTNYNQYAQPSPIMMGAAMLSQTKSYSKMQAPFEKRKKLLQIDPNAQVQTGPGLPQWEWQAIGMRWSGPTLQNQKINLWLLSPAMNSILGFVRVALLAILTVFFLWVSWKPMIKKPVIPASTMSFLLVCMLMSLPLVSSADTPSQALLDELQTRLLAPPDCLPHCASNPRLLLEIDKNQLHVQMVIHSLASIAIPLPGIAKQWLPQQVLLNGEPAQALLRQKNGQLWLSVPEGIHQVQLSGPLPKRNTVQLPFSLSPRFVQVKATGWRVEGVHENGVADKQLQFTREKVENMPLEMGNLPPFVQIERTLLLGLDWQVATRVIRKTPLGSAIVLEIPLLKGESVTRDNIRVLGAKASINLSANESEISWVSVLDKQNTINLTAPNNTFSSEIWRLDASAIWHVEIEGIPVVHHQAEGRWLPEWRPWPGETVTLHISSPKGVTGQVLTIDRSQLIINPGQRTTDNQLLLNLRSSRGMQYKIMLPEEAQLQSVKINDKSQPIRQEGRIVTLPITPGTQRIDLHFQQAIGMSQYFSTPNIELGIDSVNTNIEINMPSNRWILFVGGETIGPAVLIWGFLIVIVLLSVGLGQISLTPLKTHHWLLLGVVLSQLSISLMLCVIGWFIALGWRAHISPNLSPLKFNAIQIGLGILTVIALSSLLFAIQEGLLGHPNMQIIGNGSDANFLRWYEDRTSGILPQVWVFSLSMWIYRIAMLLWALWLAFALIRWSRWGWQSFSTGSLWKPFRKRVQT